MGKVLGRVTRAVVAASLVAAGLFAVGTTASAPAGATPPAVGHVFTIVLENHSWEQVMGATGQAKAPYLHSLESQGVLLDQMYGVDHASLTNYIAMTSGNASNADTRADCIAHYCPYPAGQDANIGDQLEAAGRTWKGYMESMPAPCTHPAVVGAADPYLVGYATRHNPFVYYDNIVSNPTRCNAHDVPFTDFATDLSANNAPNYSFIVPDTCNDAHDLGVNCSLDKADSWLAAHVPAILASPQYQADGLLIITFDEGIDARGCCGGNAKGGREHTLVLSPTIPTQARGRDTTVPYSHYSLLRTVEDIFGLGYLGHAGDATTTALGDDVFGARPTNDFSVAIGTPKVTIARSDNTAVPIAAAVKNGSPGAVSLAATSPVAGLSATFTPATVTPGGAAGSMRVFSSATAPLGETVLTVTATSGGVSHQIPMTVVVLAGPANGSFETGVLAPWTTKAVPATVVTGGLVGTKAARTGSPTPVKGTSPILQTFTVPATANTLTVRYKLTCSGAGDWVKGLLRDVVAKTNATVIAKTCTTTGATWGTATFNLVALRNKSVQLTLESHDNGVAPAASALWDEITIS